MIWLIISMIVRVCLVFFTIAVYSTMIIRIKHGFSEAVPAPTYIYTMSIAGTLLYIFQFLLPT